MAFVFRFISLLFVPFGELCSRVVGGLCGSILSNSLHFSYSSLLCAPLPLFTVPNLAFNSSTKPCRPLAVHEGRRNELPPSPGGPTFLVLGIFLVSCGLWRIPTPASELVC